ncbi:MAG: insulinase family protein [Bacteroidales bacterium]
MTILRISLLSLIYICSGLTLQAARIPDAHNFTKGRLSNGLTYFIQQNSNPEKKTELRLVVNAGSALEEDSQRGLAHFLEHMAFSGTRDFPGKLLIDTLQSIGVSFGKELNAYTSFDETVYYLPIPSDHLSLGMQILANWAFYLTLTEESIDRERGVILEEMRLGKGSRTRLQEQYMPVLFKGSPYAYQFPIGTQEVIQNFQPEELRKFYKKWYSPQNMAVIIVGDIHPEEAEKKLRQYMCQDMPNKATKFERPAYYPEKQKGGTVVIATDPEKRNCSVEVCYKHPAKRIRTTKAYKEFLIDKLYASLLTDRLEALKDSSSIYFSDADIAYSPHFRFIDTYSLFATCDPKDVLPVLDLLVKEKERAKIFGFLPSELERHKQKLQAKYQRWYNERSKTASDHFADNYQVSFLLDQPEPGIQWEYEFIRDNLAHISAKDIQKAAYRYSSVSDYVITIVGPEETDFEYPTTDQLLSFTESTTKPGIKPYQEEEGIKSLMTVIPAKGTIVKEEFIDSLNLIKWNLSNGLNVILLKTDYKDNEILFRSTAEGGYSNVAETDIMSAVNATRIQDESGVNGLTNLQLKQLMTGKDLAITQSISFYHESMWGRSAPSDLTSLFQLIHLYHVSPYFKENAFLKLIRKDKLTYSYLKQTPESCFNYYVDSIMNQGDFRKSPWPLPECLDQVDLKKSASIYESRFGNCAGFTFIFVGNIPEDKIRDLTETYLCSLPVDPAAKPGYKAPQTDKALPEAHYFRKGKEDKATVKVRFVKPGVKKEAESENFTAFVDILNNRLFSVLRLEMSGIYGVHVSGKTPDTMLPYYSLNLDFGCDPARAEILLERMNQEISQLWKDGPTQDEVERYKEKSRIGLQSAQRSNANSLSMIFKAVRNKQLPATFNTLLSRIEEITPESIQKNAAAFLNPQEGISFIHLPE